MRDKIIKIGALIVLVIGEMAALALLLVAIFLFTSYPESSLEKKSIVSLFFLVVGAIIAITSASVFESMYEVTRIEKEYDILKEEVEKK